MLRAIAILLVAASAAGATSKADDYLTIDALRAGHLPDRPAAIDTLTTVCIDRVTAYLDTDPEAGIPPLPIRDALRFLAYYPHPMAADLAWHLGHAPDLRVGDPPRTNHISDRPGPPPFTHSSHHAARTILVAVNDPRAAELVIAGATWQRERLQQTLHTLSQVPGDRARRYLADFAASETIADSLCAARVRVGWNDQQRAHALKYAEQDAADLLDAARRALRRHDLAEQGLNCPFDLPDLVLDRLLDQGLVVSGEQANEHFELLEPVYPFVTTDAVWHVFMRQVSAAFDDLEAVVLRDLTAELSVGLARASARQAASLDDPDRRDLAWRNAATASLAARQLGAADQPELPAEYEQLLARELALVNVAGGPAPSPLTGRTEDYAAYRPRGRHSDPGTDHNWYRAMTWWGRHTWHVADHAGCRRALLAVEALLSEPDLYERWRRLDGLLTLFFGPADDPTPAEVLAVAEQITGREGAEAVRAVLAAPVLLASAQSALMALPLQAVNTDPFAFPPDDARGMRLLGLRATPDARLFQRLLDAEVWPVSGLDVAAELLGSDRACEYLPADRPRLAPAADLGEGDTSLNTTGLDLLSRLFETPDAAPAVMHTDAWQDKQLNAALAAWVELRHATHVFVKEAHQYSGISDIKGGFHGYVEPYPDFYAELRELAAHVDASLDRCGLWERLAAAPAPVSPRDWKDGNPGPSYQELKKQGLSSQEIQRRQREFMDEHARVTAAWSQHRLRSDHTRWTDFQDLLAKLEDLARRELAGLPQTPADGALLRSMGHRFKRLVFNDSNMYSAATPLSCVVDVAHREGEVLEVAAGRPRALYVVVETGHRRQVCRGSVSSYHEFLRPADRRLDDHAWRHLEGTLLHEPWLTSLPAFRLERTLSRDEVARLVASPPLRHDWVRCPSRLKKERDFIRLRAPLAGLRAAPGERDLLLEMLTVPERPAYTVVWAHEQLVRLPADAASLATWRTILDCYPCGDKDLGPWQLQTVILGLARQGEDAAPLLDSVRWKVASRYPERGNETRDYFDLLIDEAAALGAAVTRPVTTDASPTRGK